MVYSSLEMLLIFLITLTLESFSMAAQSSGEMVTVSKCTCEGYDQVYECTVEGEGAILWTGAAFNCPATNNEIAFTSPNAANTSCNEGAISAFIIRADNNSYTSQLSVLVTSEVNGTDISCFSDGTAGMILTGLAHLTITTAPLPPPDDLRLVSASSTSLTFEWMPVSPKCNAVNYFINSTGCGDCPNETNQTTVTCSGEYADFDGQKCSLSVKTVVCDNVTGNGSTEIVIDFKAPDAPITVKCVPTYSNKTKRLTLILVEFTNMESYNISAGVDGSVSSYSINYRDADTNVVCASSSVLPTSCEDQVCRHTLRVASSSNCSNSRNISVTIFGNNRLGEGELSVPVYVSGIATTNQLVDVSFDWESSAAVCSFLQQHGNHEKTCNIKYGVRQDSSCEALIHQSGKSRLDKVYVGYPISDDLRQEREKCFVLTASNGTHSVIMEGSLESITGIGSVTDQSFSIGMVPLGALLGGLTLTIIIITVSFISIIVALIRSKKALLRDMAALQEKTNEPPVIYEELNYVQKPLSSSPTSTIDTGCNTAYMSTLVALTCKGCK